MGGRGGTTFREQVLKCRIMSKSKSLYNSSKCTANYKIEAFERSLNSIRHAIGQYNKQPTTGASDLTDLQRDIFTQ